MTEVVLIVLRVGFFGLAPLRHTLPPSKANQLASATRVVLPRHTFFVQPLLETRPEFTSLLTDFEPIWEGRWYGVYRWVGRGRREALACGSGGG